MPKILADKSQITFPDRAPGDHEWATPESARTKKGTPTSPGALYNQMPPGTDMDAQPLGDFPAMPYMLAGEGDVSGDVNPGAIRKGYSRKKMLPTDEMYTNEHAEAFYDDVTVEGDTGFLERNNYLDRN